MKKWEYTRMYQDGAAVFICCPSPTAAKETADKLENALGLKAKPTIDLYKITMAFPTVPDPVWQVLGKMGWELVARVGDRPYEVLFKRPVS